MKKKYLKDIKKENSAKNNSEESSREAEPKNKKNEEQPQPTTIPDDGKDGDVVIIKPGEKLKK